MLATNVMLQRRYRITSLLGRGGMGAVYRADDIRLDIAVAIKEMIAQPGLDAATLTFLREQFKREATILARLHHPSLVRVTDFFEEGGNAYLVMDFVVGESLDVLLRRHGMLAEAQVLTWAEQLLDALAYCHRQGVIHRDIKPQNVIIRSDQRAVLVDFGLVKLWDPNNPSTTQTALRGAMTPAYAPLEQYSGQTAHTDPRSDLYSLGATLYHALTGMAPHAATQRVINPALFVPPQALNPNLSPTVAAAVVRALEIQPDARFQSAVEMATALRTPVAPPPERGTGRLVGKGVAPPPTGPLGASSAGSEIREGPLAGRSLEQWLLGELRQLLAAQFSEPELRTLAVQLWVDYESLPGPGPEPKVHALVKQLQQQKRLADLIRRGQQLHPEIAWDSWGPLVSQPAPTTQELTLTLAPGVDLVLVPVPAGEFLMGSDPRQDPQARQNELPQHPVVLDAYWIGKYPLTNYQYGAFVQATQHAAPSHWPQGRVPAGLELHPVVHISWQDAVAFCEWASRQVRATGFAVGLPTEAEWEKAARGTDGRLWPWGNAQPDAQRCNFNNQIQSTTPVTRYDPQGASPYGALDMAGNVWEWVYDWYSFYAAERQVNPSGPLAGTLRVVRGGAWCNEAGDLRCAVRGWLKPTVTDDSIGVRCAAARLL